MSDEMTRAQPWIAVDFLRHTLGDAENMQIAFFIFPYIGNNNPNWRTHIFQRGRYTTNQYRFLEFVAKSV